MDSIEDKIKRYLSIYHFLYNKLKWQLHSQILMMIPLVYILNDKEFIIEEFIELSDYIKDKTNFFSSIHSYQRFSTAAVLIGSFDNPKEKFDELIEYQHKLVNKGFRKSPYLSISALALLTTESRTDDLDERVEKAIAIYKGMKDKHFLLTSYSDYPIAVLLSQFKEPVEKLMEDIEYYYQKLSSLNFKKGNDLQFLSHILMMTEIENKDFIINKCDDIYQNLVSEDLRIKRIHYSHIGLMSIIDTDFQEETKYIKKVSDLLNKEKGFKWNKDLNLIIAIVLVISDVVKNMHNDITIIETGICTSIETIIQAQNAAFIAAISSSASN